MNENLKGQTDLWISQVPDLSQVRCPIREKKNGERREDTFLSCVVSFLQPPNLFPRLLHHAFASLQIRSAERKREADTALT
jgi:hypothetical protein